MPKTDRRIRNYKNLDEQRQDNEKKRTRTRSISKIRIAIFIITMLALLVEHLPSVLSGFFTETIPVILMILVLAFPIPIIAGVIFVLSARRKRKQEEIYSNETPRSYSQHERPAKHEERYAANKEKDYAKSKSYDDYSGKKDPWDIKDAKPPWEL